MGQQGSQFGPGGLICHLNACPLSFRRVLAYWGFLIAKYARFMDPRRFTYITLIGLIILTLPCYCLGIIAYTLAPGPIPTLPPPMVTVTSLATIEGIESTFTPSSTPLAGQGPGTATPTLPSTPGQFVTETRLPTPTPSVTQTPAPSDTPAPSATVTGTATQTSTASPTATETATATEQAGETETPTPTATGTPSATPSSSPTATDTPASTATATPTPTGTAVDSPGGASGA